MSYVLDASAVLALLNNEPGAERVSDVLGDALISTVNVIEVGTKLIDSGMDNEAAWDAFELLGIAVMDLDVIQARTSIELRQVTKIAGLSLADRSCLALALREDSIAVTADNAWSRANIGCPIELIR